MAQRFKLLTYFIFAIMLAACSSEAAAHYSVSYQANPSQQGLTAYITDYDTGEKLDSVLVGTDGLVTLAGDIASPTLARLILDGNRTGVFILEQGDITIDPDSRIGRARHSTMPSPIMQACVTQSRPYMMQPPPTQPAWPPATSSEKNMTSITRPCSRPTPPTP